MTVPLHLIHWLLIKNLLCGEKKKEFTVWPSLCEARSKKNKRSFSVFKGFYVIGQVTPETDTVVYLFIHSVKMQ